MRNIIGLSGYARSGKDTAAEYLVREHGFTRIAFADALRDALYALNPTLDIIWIEDNSFAFPVSRPKPKRVRVAELVDIQGWEKAKTDELFGEEVRSLLQRLGTDVGRALLGDNVWVDIALRKMLDPNGSYVFTDVRFPNEAEALRKAGARMWRIERPGFGPVNGHPSETALDGCEFDLTIGNDADVEFFHALIGVVLL